MTNNADLFHELHRGPGVLLLSNGWDAGSAKLLESLGARAVATTSAGLAWTHARPDGQALAVEQLVATVRSIARVLAVPLTADIEAGYSPDPAKVGENVAAIVGEGAVGINLEDGSEPPELTARKIGAARKAADRAGVRLFINARTDVYLKALVDEQQRVSETLRRARMFRDAGADGFFVPKVLEADAIREIGGQCGMPLNILAWRGLPDPEALAALGVRRLSSGSAIAQAAWGRTRAAAREFLANGCPDSLFDGAMLSPELNGLFAARPR